MTLYILSLVKSGLQSIITLDLFDGILRACERLQILCAQSAALSYGTWFCDLLWLHFVLPHIDRLRIFAFQRETNMRETHTGVRTCGFHQLRIGGCQTIHVPFASLDKLEHFQLKPAKSFLPWPGCQANQILWMEWVQEETSLFSPTRIERVAGFYSERCWQYESCMQCRFLFKDASPLLCGCCWALPIHRGVMIAGLLQSRQFLRSSACRGFLVDLHALIFSIMHRPWPPWTGLGWKSKLVLYYWPGNEDIFNTEIFDVLCSMRWGLDLLSFPGLLLPWPKRRGSRRMLFQSRTVVKGNVLYAKSCRM